MSGAGKTLRQLRIDRGWSQRQVAIALDVTINSWQAWEAGRSQPKITHARNIMALFGVSWDDIDWPESEVDPAKKLVRVA